MTRPTDELEALAVRCEQATGPDRALDKDIREALGQPVMDEHGTMVEWRPDFYAAPAYTASLDAAMTLVPEGADAAGERFKVEGWNEQTVHPPHVKASAWVAGAKRAYAATPALALCAAALRAQANDRRKG